MVHVFFVSLIGFMCYSPKFKLTEHMSMITDPLRLQNIVSALLIKANGSSTDYNEDDAQSPCQIFHFRWGDQPDKNTTLFSAIGRTPLINNKS